MNTTIPTIWTRSIKNTFLPELKLLPVFHPRNIAIRVYYTPYTSRLSAESNSNTPKETLSLDDTYCRLFEGMTDSVLGKRRFGTDISGNAREPIKRPAPSFYKEKIQKKRPGKVPRSLKEYTELFASRGYIPPRQPIKRVERSFTKERKVEVLLFLECHRVRKAVPKKAPLKKNSVATRAKRAAEETDTIVKWIRPTQHQASVYWKIPENTIRNWWTAREGIFGQQGTTRLVRTTWVSCWPVMEAALFALFQQRRELGYLVRRYWFKKHSTRLFWDTYCEELSVLGKTEDALQMKELFCSSNGWFEGFCRRNRIALRRVTRQVKFTLVTSGISIYLICDM